jgi:hypothetical protein
MKKPQPTPFITSPTAEPPERNRESIRQRAYEIHEARGSEDGHDLDDWLIAEAQVTRNFTTPS